MSQVGIYLEDGLRRSALAGEHNFLRLVAEVLTDAGLTPDYRPTRDRADGEALSLVHMKPPPPGGLVFRRAYHYPFWQIDRTEKRWNWDVARATFDPSEVPRQESDRFARFWRKRLFGRDPDQGDHVYIPLQGRLSQHRSFQSCAPMDMVERVLAVNPGPVILGLHPSETYSDAELHKLEKLANRHGQTELIMGGMEHALPGARAIVTMNSSVAFNGYFFGKPAVLLARIDFHHIAIQTDLNGLEQSLNTVDEHRPDYAAYLWWFWQARAINAGRPEAKDKIRARLETLGWPV